VVLKVLNHQYIPRNSLAIAWPIGLSHFRCLFLAVQKAVFGVAK
jgi:hypothetical protein